MQRLQNPESNVDNLNNIRRQTFQEHKEGISEEKKIDEFETNSKIKNIRDLYRGINHFKKGYQRRI
jgi:hypothetical protein